ncbi:MAG: PAS domain S-box protein [Spirochaetes bacterium]|nr:PAS domain S-box protein [Spirochaetota bacterium]
MDEKKRISILIVEDSEEDAILLTRELSKAGYDLNFERVQTAEKMRDALGRAEWDAVISDHSMPRFSSFGALVVLKESGRDIPFIIVSGSIGEETAVAVMKAGAHDYIMKGNLKRLAPVLERELVEAEMRRNKRKTEKRLYKSEVRYRQLFEMMMDSFALLEHLGAEDDKPGDFLYIDLNDSYAASLGRTREEIIGKTLREAYPQVGDELFERFVNVVRTGAPDHFEYHSVSARRHFEISAYRPREGHVATVVRDITTRKTAAERQALMGYILETINRENDTHSIIQDAINLLKHHYGFDAVGLRLQQGSDYPYYYYEGFDDNFVMSENDLCAKNKEGAIITGDDGMAALECLCGQVLKGKTDFTAESFTGGGSFWTNDISMLPVMTDTPGSMIRNRNRCAIYGYRSVALIPLRSGEEITGLLQLNSFKKNLFTPDLIEFYESIGLTVGIALKRRRIEEALRESEEKYRTLVENLNDVIYTLNARGDVTYISSGCTRLFSYAAEEIIGRNFRDFIYPDDYEAVYSQFVKTMEGANTALEYRVIDKNNDIHYVRTSVNPVTVDGRVTALNGVLIDTTERKRAEEKIIASLREKEILLREIHHRVKNNMQVISSLMGLQLTYLDKYRNIGDVFYEMQNRIKSMAIVHEKLYQSEDLSKIDFKGYVTSLVATVIQSIRVDPERIAIVYDVAPLSLGIDIAVPCGLILNELLTNAFKYAFPGGRRGSVVVALAAKDEHSYRLSVRDDGVGLPDDFVMETSGSLGMRLVRILTNQIEGTLDIIRNNGVEFIITIPHKLEAAQ